MGTPGTLLLDTSAANRLLKDAAGAEQFIRRVTDQNLVCYLPLLAYQELLDGEPSHRDHRVAELGRFVARFRPGSFRIAAGYDEMVTAELAGPLAGMPAARFEREHLAQLVAWAQADKARVALQVDPALLAHLRRVKTKRHAQDRGLPEFMQLEMAKREPGAEVRCCDAPGQVLELTSLPPEDDWVSLAAPWLKPPPVMSLLLSDPARFRGFLLLVHLTLRLMFANMVPANQVCARHRSLFGMFRSKVSGNWHDNAIFALGAYADLVLAVDGDFVRRGQYLHRLGVAPCTTQLLDDFLSGLGPGE